MLTPHWLQNLDPPPAAPELLIAASPALFCVLISLFFLFCFDAYLQISYSSKISQFYQGDEANLEIKVS
jgi:hypothetical protein